MKNITLSSYYNFTSGYAEILRVLLEKLPNLNYNITPRTYSVINKDLLKHFENNKSFDPLSLDLSLLSLKNELSNTNPFLNMDFSRKRILLTMWESTRINDLLIEILNRFVKIIVPNHYCKNNLINQGCLVPIEVIQLFCDTDVFKYKPHYDNRDIFVFGISNEDPRKNLPRLKKAFARAFKNNKNVKLCVKTNNSESTEIFFGADVEIVNKKLSVSELRDWYHNLDVYVSGATCEGWGMMQQESMCCGRPIIFTDYGGLSEFANIDNGFSVSYKEVDSTGYWGDYAGKWSEFDEDDMIEKMLYCYNNRDVVINKGILASENASKFTQDVFLKKIDKTLAEYI